MTVHVVLDPSWAGDLATITPVWIVESPSNRRLVEKAWKADIEGVTIFLPSGTAEESCASILWDLWEHHGGGSASPSVSKLEVLGTNMSGEIKEALNEIGFKVSEVFEGGFSASRSL